MQCPQDVRSFSIWEGVLGKCQNVVATEDAKPHLAERAVLFELRQDERTGHQVIARRQHNKAGRRQLLRPQAHLVPHKLAPKHLQATEGVIYTKQAYQVQTTLSHNVQNTARLDTYHCVTEPEPPLSHALYLCP